MIRKGNQPLKLDHFQYDSFFISDLHFIPEASQYGHNNQKSLFILLKNLKEQGFRFDKVFIVGDGFENWFVSSENELLANPGAYHELLKSLENISKQRFYIIGNHCTRSLLMTLPRTVKSYLKKRGWKVLKEYKDDKIFVMHGHQAQYGWLQWAVLIQLAYLLYSILRWIPGGLKLYEKFVLSTIDYDKTASKNEHIQYQMKLMGRIDRGNRWLISGHTHRPVHFKKLRIVNTGDWSINKTFATQKGLDFKLWEYDEDKGVKLISPI
ncbi:putative Calcineurin-like phosphoesterase family protein [Gammaproteobacteria bacterium]